MGAPAVARILPKALPPTCPPIEVVTAFQKDSQDITQLIDLAILQKALPKLNGSAGTLSNVLDALIKVADDHDLKLCEKKLRAMQAQLKADQFVSFIQ